MDIVNTIIGNYMQFFSWDAISAVITDPKCWGIIFTLMILEGLLSADNALVLAMMVKHLPEKQQKKALLYGIWGAYAFRVLAIGVGTYLIKIWWIKLIAALYLAKMVFDFFMKKDNNKDGVVDNAQRGFWSTVVAIELMDITFSIDSVTAAFGVSSQIWVLFLGAVFGIIMMRGVAQLFVSLINKVPELETTAYILIGIISAKMSLGVFGIDVNDMLFFGTLIASFIGTFVVHFMNKRKVCAN